MRRFLSAAVVGLTAATAPAADVSSANVAYFAPNAPGIVRFEVMLDGKPVEPRWADATDKLFAWLDRDGNGTLDEKERALLNAQTGRRRPDAPAAVVVDAEIAGRLRFDKKDQAVEPAAFKDALKAAGFGPLTVQFLASRAESAALTNALFRHLDADGDAKLSVDELAAARERTEVLDVNEDEWLSTPELLARAVVANRQQVLAAPARRPQADVSETVPNDMLLLNGQALPAVKQLLARGKAKANSLSRADLGMTEKAFAPFDRDGNGQLDTDELLAWLKQPPMFTVAVSLSTDPAKAVATSAGVTLVNGTRFDVSAPGGTAGQEWAATASQLKAAFKGAAKDGVVEKANLKDQPVLSGTFAFLDRNADDKLDEKELTAATDLLTQLAACRATVTVTDQGRGLMELIDANRDGQLSLREQAAIPGVVKPILAKDGTLGRADVPRLLAVQSGYAGFRMLTTAATDGVVQFVGGMVAPQPPAAKRSGPAWFLKTDRNGDGDVSPKEFLGPLGMFQKFDADGDGLISADEARAAK
jgi:Ca2+-binding EF-hand superfamily protein